MSILIGLFLVATGLIGCNDNKKLSWINDFNYKENQIRNFSSSSSTHCPFIPIFINGQEVSILFDTGNSQGLSLTTAITDKINYEVTGTSNTLNADGTYRGDIQLIKIENINIFGKEYSNVKSSISDWRIFSSEQFNGLLGLEYFRNKIVTLDYKNNKIAVTDKEIDYKKLSTEKYTIVPLIRSNIANRSDILYFQGEVNGEKSIIYLDTGYSHSIIDLKENNNLKADNTAQIKIDNKQYQFKNLRCQEIKRGESFEYPTKFIIGSDILKSNNFLITIDKIQNKLILRHM
jgi:predicted aspartyl protease